MSDSHDIHNVMEDLVEERLDACIAMTGVCSCDFCRADMKALALNKLPPRYASRLKGNLFARIQATRNQSSADVLSAVMEAISIVSEHPRHGNDR